MNLEPPKNRDMDTPSPSGMFMKFQIPDSGFKTIILESGIGNLESNASIVIRAVSPLPFINWGALNFMEPDL
jgi:hypothetical protein